MRIAQKSATSPVPPNWLKRVGDKSSNKDSSTCHADACDSFDDIVPLDIEESLWNPVLIADLNENINHKVEQNQTSTALQPSLFLAIQPTDGNDYHALRPSLVPSIQPTEQLLRSFTASRSEFAALFTPPVISDIPTIQPLFSYPEIESFTDPLSLSKRPSETTVAESEACFRSKGPATHLPVGVQIEGLGVFSEEGIYLLRKFCHLSTLKHQIREEIRWLDQIDGFCDTERSLIARFLWHKAPTEVIFSQGVKMVDVEALSNLAGERYLDNMTMDACILKYAALAHQRGMTGTLYLPFEIWTWLQKFSLDQLGNRLAVHVQGTTPIDQVIAMVHFSSSLHWGLLVIDIKGQKLYFDDGYNCKPESFVIEGAKKILDSLCKMFPLQPSLQTLFWRNMKRDDALGFGMDNQTIAATVYGQGAGSCGVGVILAAKDFIEEGSKAVNNLSWKYKDMRLHRKQLMLQIISWK